MQINPLPPGGGMASALVRYTEQAAKNAMAGISGKVQPVFDTGKPGTVAPDPVNLARETFSAMENGTITYNSVGKMQLTGGWNPSGAK